MIEQNNALEEQRKEQIRRQQQRAEERQQKLSQERAVESEQKRKWLEDKERHSLEVRKQMEAREFNRVDHIQRKRQEKDSVMAKTQAEKDWQLMLKKEMDAIKREDKQENVERIQRAQDYKKQKVMEKIEYGNAKSEHVKREKDKLMETRFAVRREAEKQKETIMGAFESMKKRGKVDNQHLQKLGLDIEIKEEPRRETEADKQDIQQVKERQARELKALLDEEKQAEVRRKQQVDAAEDEDEKQRLLKEHEQASALSSDKIAKLQQSHQHEIKTLTQQ